MKVVRHSSCVHLKLWASKLCKFVTQILRPKFGFFTFFITGKETESEELANKDGDESVNDIATVSSDEDLLIALLYDFTWNNWI